MVIGARMLVGDCTAEEYIETAGLDCQEASLLVYA